MLELLTDLEGRWAWRDGGAFDYSLHTDREWLGSFAGAVFDSHHGLANISGACLCRVMNLALPETEQVTGRMGLNRSLGSLLLPKYSLGKDGSVMGAVVQGFIRLKFECGSEDEMEEEMEEEVWKLRDTDFRGRVLNLHTVPGSGTPRERFPYNAVWDPSDGYLFQEARRTVLLETEE